MSQLTHLLPSLSIPNIISSGKGVDDFEIDLPNKRVMVTTSTLSPEELAETLAKTGKETRFVGDVAK